MKRIPFIVTIDTEGDDLWKNSRPIEVKNASFLPRFQRLCESHGILPTYLVDYEMAASEEFRDFGRDVLRRNAGEIGMHLHGWNSPPMVALTADDGKFHPYLFEYPFRAMENKISFLTALLEDTFGLKIVSHRAGRFGFSESYAALLVKHGYSVDCSVTPLVSWKKTLGDPARQGGPDYTRFPDAPYLLDLDDIGRSGTSSLLEVPVSIVRRSPLFFPAVYHAVQRFPRLRHYVKRAFFDVSWLQPNGANLESMLQIVRSGVAEDRSHLEFILHSSELMPGGSPTFRTKEAIQILYEHLEQLFGLAGRVCRPMTLKEFRDHFVETAEKPSAART